MAERSFQVVLGHQVDNPEICDRIYVQYCDLKDAMFPNQPDEGKVLAVLLDLMKKLESVRYHRDNLINIAQTLVAKVPESVASDASQAIVQDFTSGIEKEFEAFLMQGKATLDVLAKLFNPLFEISLHTFGDAGEAVIKATQNNLPASCHERGERLATLIADNKDWIARWFKQERDTIAHYHALQHSGVIYDRKTGGGAAVSLPRTRNGELIHEVVDSAYGKLLGFCEDFMCFSMAIKFPPIFQLATIPLEKRDKSKPRKYCLKLSPEAISENNPS